MNKENRDDKKESPVGYRPSKEVKQIFEEICGGSASISRSMLIEIAMKNLIDSGSDKMKEIIISYLINKTPKVEQNKKGVQKKAG